MKKILLPTDFSDNSWNAIKYALQLYKNEKCNFTLLHTYTPVVYQVEYMQSSSAQLQVMNVVKETAKKKLSEIQQKINSEFSNSKHIFSKILSFNTLTSEIEELYQGNAMDIIVMGTKGATGLKEVLFGSNTVHILKRAKCPVLAVPSNFSFETPHEILFPSDYEIDFKNNHLQSIIDIATVYHSRVNILNASYGYDLSEQQENNRQKLETQFKHVAHLFHSVSNQNVPEAITKFQLKTRINLLVMINNKHSFFENLFFKSTINQIGFHLNVPFLVIPAKP
ncbi:universal stress protein [Mariniflexile litorale]|uniref:Universal stress protein n=1 Tax=Mariniflexile litorale TaxID=3045158 RepID=A0AAU7EDK4_9FLAO|nr:universal stress protein [Mariniflexile sp. KMM 9835]MDQ8212438.1 universal stress protein [Mariniflexile sp. KMM 9835]